LLKIPAWNAVPSGNIAHALVASPATVELDQVKLVTGPVSKPDGNAGKSPIKLDSSSIVDGRQPCRVPIVFW
jgi:hypothetical protein